MAKVFTNKKMKNILSGKLLPFQHCPFVDMNCVDFEGDRRWLESVFDLGSGYIRQTCKCWARVGEGVM